MEDEAGAINVIVKPGIYERDKHAVRLEPFLAVRGRLQKDGASLNVIAESVTPLRVPGAPVRRSGLSRSREDAEHRNGRGGPPQSGPTPFRYLTALRQSPPGIKSFG
jgi:hypothetical protein